MLKSTVVWFTWCFIVVFFSVETYLTWSHAAANGADASWNLLSEYSVNVFGPICVSASPLTAYR